MSYRPDAGERRVLALMAELTLRAQTQPPRNRTEEGPAPVEHSHTEVGAQVEAARSHARSAVTVPPSARLAALKRVVLRGARIITVPQIAATDSLANAVVNVAAEVRAMEDGSVAKAVALEMGLDESVTAMQRQLSDQQRVTEQMEQALQAARQELAALRAEQVESRHRLSADLRRQEAATSRIVREVRAAVADGREVPALPVFAETQQVLDAQFYDDFEAAFRGGRDAIKALQREHLDVARAAATKGAPLLDLGCGRGEWLELLRDEDVPSYGVDTNELFAAQGRERGLDVRLGDGIAHLQSLPSGSLGAVTAFHLVEHLPVETVVRLLDAALDALRPGGLLLLETPNPTNVVVGAAAFYLDPTHLRPVHPAFLEFLAQTRGYVDTELRYLHPQDEDQRPLEAEDPRVAALLGKAAWALTGPQDYALLARKASAASTS